MPIPAPFIDISVHVMQSPGVGLLFAYWMSSTFTVFNEPAILAQMGWIISIAERGCAFPPAGVFPLRFGGEIPLPATRHG